MSEKRLVIEILLNLIIDLLFFSFSFFFSFQKNKCSRSDYLEVFYDHDCYKNKKEEERVSTRSRINPCYRPTHTAGAGWINTGKKIHNLLISP